MFGGRGGEAPAQEVAPESGYAQPAGVAPAGPACAFETRSFLECMTNAGDNMEYCRGVFDAFKHCNNATMQQQYQPQQYR